MLLLFKILNIKSIHFAEFSEALREMGTCLLEKIAINDDEESGNGSKFCFLVYFVASHLSISDIVCQQQM